MENKIPDRTVETHLLETVISCDDRNNNVIPQPQHFVKSLKRNILKISKSGMMNDELCLQYQKRRKLHQNSTENDANYEPIEPAAIEAAAIVGIDAMFKSIDELQQEYREAHYDQFKSVFVQNFTMLDHIHKLQAINFDLQTENAQIVHDPNTVDSVLKVVNENKALVAFHAKMLNDNKTRDQAIRDLELDFKEIADTAELLHKENDKFFDENASLKDENALLKDDKMRLQKLNLQITSQMLLMNMKAILNQYHLMKQQNIEFRQQSLVMQHYWKHAEQIPTNSNTKSVFDSGEIALARGEAKAFERHQGVLDELLETIL